MLLHVPEVLSRDQVAQIRQLIDRADWADGKITAGTQSEQVKNNQQLPEGSPAAVAARQIILDALGKHALFFTGALPKKIFPPLFNRYTGNANTFGNHIDNSVRTSKVTGAWVRTDLSMTLFLCDPGDYEGGELIIEDTFGTQSVKLPAGDLILYPSSSVHRVAPVTSGTRTCSFFWLESMVREDERRRLLFDLDMAILTLRAQQGDSDEVIKLTGCYHNLMRMWAET